MSNTVNEEIYGKWVEVLNLKYMSNCSRDATVEFWTGVVAPVDNNKGHQLTYGVGVDNSILDPNDRFFIRSTTGRAVVCITRTV